MKKQNPKKKTPKRNANKFTFSQSLRVNLLVCECAFSFCVFFAVSSSIEPKFLFASSSGKTVKTANRKQHLKWQLGSGESPLGGTRTKQKKKLYGILFFLLFLLTRVLFRNSVFYILFKTSNFKAYHFLSNFRCYCCSSSKTLFFSHHI